MIYRSPASLPPCADTYAELATDAICEAAIRKELVRGSEFDRLLALDVLTIVGVSELVKRVLKTAEEMSVVVKQAGIEHVPFGAGERYAEGGGGRVCAVLEPWRRSLWTVVGDGMPRGPAFRDWRAMWDLAHPEWAKLFAQLIVTYPSVSEVKSAWDAALSKDAIVKPC